MCAALRSSAVVNLPIPLLYFQSNSLFFYVADTTVATQVEVWRSGQMSSQQIHVIL